MKSTALNNKIIINTSALKVRLLNLVNLVKLVRRCCKKKSWVLNLGDVSTLFKYKYYTTTAARRARARMAPRIVFAGDDHGIVDV